MRSEESPEAKFDRLKKQLQDSILRDYPNPERKGCPGGAVLRELAERPLEQAVEEDPHWLHVTHCSECYREFLASNDASRLRAKVRRARIGWGLAVAAVVLILAVLVGLNQISLFPKRPRNAELAYVKKTLVIPSMTRSGEGDQQQPIFFDRLPLELTVRLPIGSKPGVYDFQLKGNGREVLSTRGNAQVRNGAAEFTVKIDLSNVERGEYSIVVRQVPFEWNYYPVVIR